VRPNRRCFHSQVAVVLNILLQHIVSRWFSQECRNLSESEMGNAIWSELVQLRRGLASEVVSNGFPNGR
jgi:hypothetical protein